MNRLLARALIGALACLWISSSAQATVVFDQPHNGTGTLHKSSWYPPDGLDGDAYCWDNFTLATATAITDLHWRGGYELHPTGGQSPVYDFEISIYRSIPGDSQPDMGAGGRLVHYLVGGNAAETAAGSFGGVNLYDYGFLLPSPFQAEAGKRYWVEIVAWQNIVYPSYAPDWGLAVGTGGNNSHFRFITGGTYQQISNDLAFSLMASSAPTVAIAASVSPVGTGTISGAGNYPIGSLVTLVASANPGYGFVNWTDHGVPVGTNPTLTFSAIVDRTLVANFDAAFTIATFSSPSYGGTTSGGGVYTNGATVTVTATPAHGFVFAGWSDGSPDAVHAFPATSDLWITAFFTSAADAVTFDFDAGPVSSSLPLDWTINGLTGHFTGGFSVQPVGTVGISPIGFSGNCIWPNSVFPSDLVITFSERLKDLSILVATADNVCDISSRMRVTAYLGANYVATNTVVPPQGSYPSATLSIADANGFDKVVVHWDAPGSVCQDYAPIFLADIVTVTRASLVGVGDEPVVLRPQLLAPAPSPFRDQTVIRFELPRAAETRLQVFDLAGRLVRTLASGTQPAGRRAVSWNGLDDRGRRLAAGVYLVRLETAGFRAERRAVRID